ncbi:hypothetical protein AAFF_G00048930 [Aldrovandia affinis]|uniref:Uncharacterized protein n=1 Tax=Aldrovandia affinis TaxID=143900 RepID=A0AAD7S1B2_9TELE|nr:hypothetical protein AAFF_G00048930 [Aldrovandia affinis]
MRCKHAYLLPAPPPECVRPGAPDRVCSALLKSEASPLSYHQSYAPQCRKRTFLSGCRVGDGVACVCPSQSVCRVKTDLLLPRHTQTRGRSAAPKPPLIMAFISDGES